EKHIYVYVLENTKHYIKMNIFESKDVWLGFVQDYTRQISEKNQKKSTIKCDPITRLPTYEAFTDIVKDKLKRSQNFWLASIHLNGLDKLGTFLTVENTNHCITSVSEAIKGFGSDDIIFGSKSYYEICVLFNNLDKNSVYSILKNMNDAVKHCVLTDDFGEVIDISDRSTLSLSVGCCAYPEQAYEFNMLVNYSEFALFEARNSKKKNVVNWFCEERYRREKTAYKNAQIFTRLIRENQLKYYFQPIVNAVNGEIYGYEALMRTSDDINLSPTQIIAMAQEHNNLYAIEKLTFFNVMKLLSKNQQFFKNRKLFINSVASFFLTDEDFNKLYLTYGELMEKVVIEITEQNNPTSNDINLLKKRCITTHSRLAIDDYGTGYSNSVNLLNYSPDYVKIDRSLISKIQNDLKKQQLVSSVIDFAHDNNIMILAEGVETSAELKTVIRMGIDLIQGFYTSTPKPVFLDMISQNVKDEIINTNLENSKHGIKKIYSARNCSEIDILSLALEGYTDIHIYQSRLKIKGDINKPVKINITLMDNHSCELILENVSIESRNAKPTIIVGESAQLILNIQKENKISYLGIYVPQTSQFFLNGDGRLVIDCYASSGFAIGNDYEHSYGDICIDMEGILEITGNSEETVCIGGGLNPNEAEINLKSGKIKVDMHSQNGVAVGSYNGGAIVNIADKCNINLDISGIKVVAIGSVESDAFITSSADIEIYSRGASTVGIGSFHEADGNISIDGGNINIKMRSAKNAGIGSWNGNMNVNVKDAHISIDNEGEDVAGIGDIYGSGDVFAENSDIDIRILAATPIDIGSKNGKTVLENNKIKSLINEKEVFH
ncbi:MAG: GGDEF domain-containing protein, partial [Oscillospiraceae bacterium]|nr:GGDEF domain-containing protein [Oscillospiraceae bacterium]